VSRAKAWSELAERDLARGRRALREELTNLDKQIEQYRAEQQFAQRVLDRSRKLMRQNALPAEQYQEAEKQREVACARRQQAEARKEAQREKGTQEAEAEVAKRRKELEDARAVLRLLEAGTRPEEIDAEEARLARRQEEARYLEGLQDKLCVSSPVPGLLTTPRMKEKVGRYVQEGELIAEVEEPDSLEAEVALAELDVAEVRPGQPVVLKTRALPFQTFRGRVERIAPRASSAEAPATVPKPPRGELPGTVTVYCRFEGANAELRPGMTGHARVRCGRRPAGELLVGRLLRFLRTEFWW
jgi:multidrug resistance efflux pump